jgi:hypothetical protein
VKLRCPSCLQEYSYNLDFRKGTHHEHECDCGAKLQADFPMKSQTLAGGGFSIDIGPPQPCAHQDKRDAAALMPIQVF